MNQKKIILSDDQLTVLSFLAKHSQPGGWIDQFTIQRGTVYPVRMILVHLERFGFVEASEGRGLIAPLWQITPAGREAVS